MMRTKHAFTTLAVLAIVGTFTVFSEESAPRPAGDGAAKPASAPDAYTARLLQLKEPRDKYMAQVNELNAKVEARKAAIAEEDEEVAALAKEVAALEAKLVEKSAALEAKYAADEKIKELGAKSAELRKEYAETVRKMATQNVTKTEASQESSATSQKAE